MAHPAARRARETRRRAPVTLPPPAAERLEPRRLLSAEMVFDINATPDPSAPADFAALGNTVYFRAHDTAHGYELWKSDGTAGGTTLVKDIVPGGSSPNISNLTASGGKVYFLTDAAVAGSALWVTDGTDAGTVKVKDVYPLDTGAGMLLDVGGTLYFASGSGTASLTLWKSDGTPTGSVPVKVIAAPQAGGFVRHLTRVGDTVYFVATDEVAGDEVWKSDGTEAGTARVKDIRPGQGGSSPDELTAVGDTLYFKATTGDFAQGLWRTDGTDAGTIRLYAGSGLAHPGVLENLNGTLYFAPTFGGLWKTDGTVPGTVQVSNLPASVGGNPRELTRVNGKLFFPVYDGAGPTAWELWTSDGTSVGTRLLTRFANATPNKNINQLTPAGDRLLFSADDGTSSGNELWISDGTPAGTRMLRELVPGAADGIDRFRAGFTPTPGGTVYFRGEDPVAGIELWKTDGTAPGTVLVSDINPVTPGSDPRLIAHHDGTMYLTAQVPGSNDRSLWKTDGTAAGTAMVKLGQGVPDYNQADQAMIFQGKLFYVGYDRELWKSDGTEAGTAAVTNFGPLNNAMWRLTPLGDRMFFYRPTVANGTELWTTDGTAAGTRRFTTLQPTYANWQVIGNQLYFAAIGTSDQVELWKTDGTEAGTTRVLAVTPIYPAQSIYGLMNVAGTLYFFNEYQSGWAELWKSDGTPAGTTKVKDGIRIGTRRIYAAAGGIIYFAVDDPVVGDEIWRSDGTAAGTGLLKDIYPGDSSPFFHNGSRPDHFTESNGKLVFIANDGVSGGELWKSDGTPAGTVRIKDILPGPLGAIGPAVGGKVLVDVNGTVFFVATDTTAPNYELWRTDGTEAGTQLVRDIFPGPTSSYPGGFAAFGNTLLFAAVDPVKGRELWRATPWAAVKDRQVLPAGGAVPAVTSGKLALLPGQAATFANVTPSARGITSVAIDTANLPAGAQLSAADFALSVGNGSSWTPMLAPPAVSVARGAGAGGTDRITLTLAGGAVKNAWLRVTVNPTENTELPAPDVFYFGSLPGDAGGAGTPTVNAADVAAVRAHLGSTAAANLVRYDFDGSGVVDAADLLVSRNNQRRLLPLFTAPATSSAGTPAAPAGSASIPPAPPRTAVRPERRSLFGDTPVGLLV